MAVTVTHKLPIFNVCARVYVNDFLAMKHAWNLSFGISSQNAFLIEPFQSFFAWLQLPLLLLVVFAVNVAYVVCVRFRIFQSKFDMNKALIL